MRTFMRTLLTLLLICLLPLISSAQWPTTVEENLIADSIGIYPSAFPYDNGSTRVVYWHNGPRYQVIDPYGQLMYDPPVHVWPNYTGSGSAVRRNREDGQGGIIASWAVHGGVAQGNWAQRINAQGNICWGDSTLRVFPFGNSNWGLCSDEMGGWFFAIGYYSLSSLTCTIRLQHINNEGQLMHPDSGLVLIESTNCGAPEIVPDGSGGVFVVWQDWRPPYTGYGATYRQHFDAQLQPTWGTDGILIAPAMFYYQVFPDGQGGLIVHGAPDNSELYSAYRFSPSGDLLWELPGISRGWGTATMIPGEPDFFYIGWAVFSNETVYAQRIDVDGNVYWPTSGPGTGAIVSLSDEWDIEYKKTNFSFYYPYFYAFYIYTGENPYQPPSFLYAQSLTLEGERRFGDVGTLFSEVTETGYVGEPTNIVPDQNGGAVPVWYVKYVYQLYAKHINADGSIGGPTWPPPYQHQPGEPFIVGISGNQVKYSLIVPGEVTLEIFNVLGQSIQYSVFQQLTSGIHTAQIDTKQLSSGIYFGKITTPTSTKVFKFPMVR